MTTSDLRPALRKLAADSASATTRQLWRALSTDERDRALFALLRDEVDSDENRARLIAAIAVARHFRVQTVERWDDEKLAAWASRLDVLNARVVQEAMVAWHLRERTQLLDAFLDGIGIPHDAGLVRDGFVPSAPVAASSISAAADALLETHGRPALA